MTDDRRPYASSNIPPKRKRITLDVEEELHERLLDAVSFAQHHGEPGTTKIGTVQRGMELAIAEIAKRHGVDEFPPRSGALRPGARPTE